MNPATIILHFDYTPYDEQTQDDGWDIAIIESEVRQSIEHMMRHTVSLVLREVEPIDGVITNATIKVNS